MKQVRFQLTRILSIAAFLLAAAILSIGVGSAVVGCSQFHQTGKGIPTGAKFLMESTGPLAFTTPKNGKLFLYDATAKHLISGFIMQKGQTFTFDPATGETEVTGGKKGGKSKFNVENGHLFRLYGMETFEF